MIEKKNVLMKSISPAQLQVQLIYWEHIQREVSVRDHMAVLLDYNYDKLLVKQCAKPCVFH